MGERGVVGHHRCDQPLSSARNRTSTLRCTSFSGLKGASGTTDEDFALLSLRACLSLRVIRKTPDGEGGAAASSATAWLLKHRMMAITLPCLRCACHTLCTGGCACWRVAV